MNYSNSQRAGVILYLTASLFGGYYNYTGLSDDEVSKYILHKIQLAGASSTIIDPAALAAAHSFTQGNPRLIDNLMTDALTIGSQQNKKVIDSEIIRAAVDNQGLY